MKKRLRLKTWVIYVGMLATYLLFMFRCGRFIDNVSYSLLLAMIALVGALTIRLFQSYSRTQNRKR